jgi:CRISPR-associated endonuclease/helicase Cas3
MVSDILKNYFAHSFSGESPEKWQLLETHLANVAKLASEFAVKFDSADWGWNAGWLHDMGKAAGEFQAYLLRENGLDDSQYDEAGNGRVNHSSAGAAFAEEKYGEFIGRTLAYIVAGHHAGLPDYHGDLTGAAALVERLKEGEKNLTAIRGVSKSIDERIRIISKPPHYVKPANFHLWVRFLYSCVVDADYLDTEGFMNPGMIESRKGFDHLDVLKRRFDNHMEKKVAELARPFSEVNVERQIVLERCRRAADEKPGLFSLTVPTGGGKTLSAMAFALNHAIKFSKKRVIYVIPYTSIIEQTAAILSEILGAGNIVEHHSNLDPENETQRSRLAAENWDAPIVVTTNVQFFESLFSAKSSRCRKLHNLVGSVVILDEAQLLPPKWLKPCVQIINELIRNYGVTIVLATATQPSLPDIEIPREIILDPAQLYEKLRRTEIVFPMDIHIPTCWPEIASKLLQQEQVLCVVNSRRDCHDLFRLMPEGTIHLSALMCGEHRYRVIANIKQLLKDGYPCRVISTQLVEAGVDIDFPVVYRALAGLDSVAQAGGRCNREGRLNAEGKLGRVEVFVPPKAAPRGLLRKGADTTKELAAISGFDPQNLVEYKRFFDLFYSRVNDLGEQWLKERLQVSGSPEIHFRTAGREFQLIEDQQQQPVFVSFAGSVNWIEELRKSGPNRNLLRRLQRYCVNLSKWDFDKANAAGQVEQIREGYWCWLGGYQNEIGLDIFGAGWAAEDLIV